MSDIWQIQFFLIHIINWNKSVAEWRRLLVEAYGVVLSERISRG